jgi:hypothetical protein
MEELSQRGVGVLDVQGLQPLTVDPVFDPSSQVNQR